MAYRKQNKGNYYSSLVGGLWLISLRAAARRRGNLTVLIKRSAAAQSNYGETMGLCWGLSPTLGSGRAEHVLSSQGALWQGKVGAPPRFQVPSPMSVLMPGLPKPLPGAKQFWGCGTGSPTGTLSSITLVATISQRRCHVTLLALLSRDVLSQKVSQLLWALCRLG